jgi:hypothetical protein
MRIGRRWGTRNMIFHGGETGNVMNPPSGWGPRIPHSRADLRMRIARTPFGVSEPQPVHVPNWGRVGITPNGALISLGDFGTTTDDALAALDSVGTRGATIIGAGVGFVLSSNRLLGGAIGAGLGYLTGKYLANIIKVTVAAQKVVSVAVADKTGGT